MISAFHNHPQEAAIIGQLLAGYSELEFELATCLIHFVHDEDAALKALFRPRGERVRIEVADGLMYDAISKLGLGPQYADAIGAMRHCLKIRNQFAHCHWMDKDINNQLAFTDLSEALKGAATKPLNIRSISLSLLQEQESYFIYARDCFWFIEFETQLRQEKIKSHRLSMPAKRSQPNLCNP